MNNPNFQPYPAYRPSGVPWLGDVPEHWDVWRGKALLRPVDIRSKTGDEELLTVSAQRGVVPRKSANVTMFKAESYVGYKLCWPGDLVINSLWAWAHGLGVSQHHGIVSSAYGVYRPLSKVHDRFIHLLARSVPFQWELQVRSKGIWVSRLQLTDEEFLRAPFPLPPLPEQRAIVRYLDHADRRIRRYVSAKRRLIALLEEEKQAIVNRAVTRGLDPNVRLKPSGVEWLGDVPEHWEVRRLRSLAAIGTGGRDTINRKEDGLYPFFVRSQTVERIDTWSFDGEAVLTAGDGVGVGKVFHYVNGKFDYHQRVYKFSEFRHLLGQFFFHYVRSMLRNEVFQGTAKSTVDSLRLPMLQDFPVALPPPSEQRAIFEYLNEATVDIDSAIVRARRQIELVQEYRTKLIADVVTGKLDVREAAAQLPEEADDQDPVEESGPLADGMDEALYDIDESAEELAIESEVSA